MLLVEDDDSTRISLAELLGLDGWKVRTADDGAEALDMLRDGLQPSIIVTDYMMPRLDGLTMLQQIRNDPELATPPLVLISAMEMAPETYVDQVDAYFRKPLDMVRLRHTLVELVSA